MSMPIRVARGAGGGVAQAGAALPSGGGTQKGMPKIKVRLIYSEYICIIL